MSPLRSLWSLFASAVTRNDDPCTQETISLESQFFDERVTEGVERMVIPHMHTWHVI